MSADVTPAQLAALAEIKVWTLLLDADAEFGGMPPSIVRAHARHQVDHLETLVSAVPLAERQTVLDPGRLPDEERDHAFVAAAVEMASTMRMIDAILSGAA